MPMKLYSATIALIILLSGCVGNSEGELNNFEQSRFILEVNGQTTYDLTSVGLENGSFLGIGFASETLPSFLAILGQKNNSVEVLEMYQDIRIITLASLSAGNSMNLIEVNEQFNSTVVNRAEFASVLLVLGSAGDPKQKHILQLISGNSEEEVTAALTKELDYSKQIYAAPSPPTWQDVSVSWRHSSEEIVHLNGYSEVRIARDTHSSSTSTIQYLPIGLTRNLGWHVNSPAHDLNLLSMQWESGDSAGFLQGTNESEPCFTSVILPASGEVFESRSEDSLMVDSFDYEVLVRGSFFVSYAYLGVSGFGGFDVEWDGYSGLDYSCSSA